MKHCRACDVDVATPAVLCPLCGTPLAGLADADCAAVYPPAGSRKEYNFVKRLLLLLSVVGAAVCIVVNLLVMPSFWWWTIVVTALVYAWAVVPHAMRRGGNAAGKVLMQVVAGSALAVLVDFETGYRGWGVSFVVPAFICAGIVAVVVLVMCNRTNWAGYVLYQAVLAVFGLAMPVLYFTGLAHSLSQMRGSLSCRKNSNRPTAVEKAAQTKTAPAAMSFAAPASSLCSGQHRSTVASIAEFISSPPKTAAQHTNSRHHSTAVSPASSPKNTASGTADS